MRNRSKRHNGTQEREHGEDGEPPRDGRFLLGEPLYPVFPTEMQLEMPCYVGEEAVADSNSKLSHKRNFSTLVIGHFKI